MREIKITGKQAASAALIALLAIVLAVMASCSKDETEDGNEPAAITLSTGTAASEDAVMIRSEDELRTFLGHDGSGDEGYIAEPLTLTGPVTAERSGITLKAAPGAVLTISFPEDGSFGWPVINTMDAITVKASDVIMDGLSIFVPDNGNNAYAVIKADGARRFTFTNGSIAGQAVADGESITDYTVSTGISIGAGCNDAEISNVVISDALTPVRISAGGTRISNLIFNSDIRVSYGYGTEEDITISGCTSIPNGTLPGGTVTFKKTAYGEAPSPSLLEKMKAENTSVVFSVI